MRYRATPAVYARIRRAKAVKCGCQLCVWMLIPPMTMKDHAARMAVSELLNTLREQEAP